MWRDGGSGYVEIDGRAGGAEKRLGRKDPKSLCVVSKVRSSAKRVLSLLLHWLLAVCWMCVCVCGGGKHSADWPRRGLPAA